MFKNFVIMFYFNSTLQEVPERSEKKIYLAPSFLEFAPRSKKFGANPTPENTGTYINICTMYFIEECDLFYSFFLEMLLIVILKKKLGVIGTYL